MNSPLTTPVAARSRRLLLVTGKGGVGKTTVTAALALAFAAQGKRVLIAMGGAHERLSALLQTPAIGHSLVQVRDRIWATRIVPEHAMEEYGQMVIGVKAITRLVFSNQYTQAFFRAVPGLPEWSILGKAWYLSTEQSSDGNPRFDTVLFDAPSTGHALHMLSIPSVILALAPSGALRRDAEQATATFRDPARSGVVLVTNVEEMAISETLELAAAVRDRLQMPLWGMVLNGVRSPAFSVPERDALSSASEALGMAVVASAAAPTHDPAERARAVVAAAARRAVREGLQERSIARLREAISAPLVRLPFLVEGVDMPDAVEQLAAELSRPSGDE